MRHRYLAHVVDVCNIGHSDWDTSRVEVRAQVLLLIQNIDGGWCLATNWMLHNMMVARHATITSHGLHLSAVVCHVLLLVQAEIHHAWSRRRSLTIAATVRETPNMLLVVRVLLVEHGRCLLTLTGGGGACARLRTMVLRRIHL